MNAIGILAKGNPHAIRHVRLRLRALSPVRQLGSGTSAPTASLALTPTSIPDDQSSTLTWTSKNATACTGTGFNTGGATSNSVGVNVSPTVTTTYTLTCSGAGGQVQKSRTATVTFAIGQTVAGANNPIYLYAHSTMTAPVIGSEGLGNPGVVVGGPVPVTGGGTAWQVAFDDNLTGWLYRASSSPRRQLRRSSRSDRTPSISPPADHLR